MIEFHLNDLHNLNALLNWLICRIKTMTFLQFEFAALRLNHRGFSCTIHSHWSPGLSREKMNDFFLSTAHLWRRQSIMWKQIWARDLLWLLNFQKSTV